MFTKVLTALFALGLATALHAQSPQQKSVEFGISRFGITATGDIEFCPYNYENCITFGSIDASSETNRRDFKGIPHGNVGFFCNDLLHSINKDEDTNGTFPVNIKGLTGPLLAKIGMRGEVKVNFTTCCTDAGYWIGALFINPLNGSLENDWTFGAMAAEINMRPNPLYQQRYRH